MRNNNSMYDIGIIGAGIYGSTLADHYAKAGYSVALFDDGKALKRTNSSTGETRLFRETILENQNYIKLARITKQYLEQLQAFSDEPLFQQTGFALVAEPDASNQTHHGVQDIFKEAIKVAKSMGIIHSITSGREFREHYPWLCIDASSNIFIEPGALTLFVDRIQATLFKKLESYQNLHLLLENKIDRYEESSQYVTLFEENQTKHVCRKLVIASGSGEIGVLKDSQIQPQYVGWFDIPHTETFPVLVVTRPNKELLFGFPSLLGTGSKWVAENIEHDAPTRLNKLVNELVPSATSTGKSEWCNYVTRSDSQVFVQSSKRTHIINGCSGHGYKLAPGVTQSLIENWLVE